MMSGYWTLKISKLSGTCKYERLELLVLQRILGING